MGPFDAKVVPRYLLRDCSALGDILTLGSPRQREDDMGAATLGSLFVQVVVGLRTVLAVADTLSCGMRFHVRFGDSDLAAGRCDQSSVLGVCLVEKIAEGLGLFLDHAL